MSRIKLITGAVTPDSAKVWVQSNGGGQQVQVTLNSDSGEQHALGITTDTGPHHTAVAHFSSLSPDTSYTITADFGGGDSATGLLKTFPSSRSAFSFLLVSCNKNEKGKNLYKKVDKRFRTQPLSFIMHSGDQVYYNHEESKAKPTPARYNERYNTTWGKDPYAARMLGHFPNFMVLDDHEIANDFNKDKLTQRSGKHAIGDYLTAGLPSYVAFQHSHNPDSPIPGRFFYTFSCAGAEFFVLDVRLDRLPYLAGANRKQIISDEQQDALQRWLLQHKDSLKFIVSPFPMVGHVSKVVLKFAEGKWNSGGFKKQRNDIFKFIAQNGIGKLVFLTGDMHGSYHATLELTGPDKKIKAHEIMSSPVFHKLRPYAGVGMVNRARTWNLGGGYKATADTQRIFASRSVVEIVVPEDHSSVSYNIFGIRKEKWLRRGTFTLS